MMMLQYHQFGWIDQAYVYAYEMEKRADAADAAVLFFSLAVLIFWLDTTKLDKNTVLYALC